MRKYLIILVTLAIVTLMISNATAVPRTKSEFINKILNQRRESQQIIEDRIQEFDKIIQEKLKMDDKVDKISELFKQKTPKLILGPSGPFLDWLRQLIEALIAIIKLMIEFIEDLLSIGSLIELLISLVQQLIQSVISFIEWLMDLFNPNLEVKI
jgi:hypothetical protein